MPTRKQWRNAIGSSLLGMRCSLHRRRGPYELIRYLRSEFGGTDQSEYAAFFSEGRRFPGGRHWGVQGGNLSCLGAGCFCGSDLFSSGRTHNPGVPGSLAGARCWLVPYPDGRSRNGLFDGIAHCPGGKSIFILWKLWRFEQRDCGRASDPAYRDEGTSYHYLPVSDYVEIPTHAHLSQIMDELHLPHVSGRVRTTDAFYRETRSNMENRKADGCIAVDMECASVMAAGQFRGVPVYQFLYADDCLDGDHWDPRTLGARPSSSHEMYLRVALEIAAKL